MKKIQYIMLSCTLVTLLFSCTPESTINPSSEVACCGEDGHIPPPPPPIDDGK
ncbi:hypothetical protein SCB49_02464 [unidentified eubacterium SCB49]|nr:hypothetical protein SCB49_02464 [unidentified eubacterium SCB49]